MSAHWCLLDAECRQLGVPGFLYLFAGSVVIRVNPWVRKDVAMLRRLGLLERPYVRPRLVEVWSARR